jgi:predicted site-specific integrase-resolvase
MVEKREMKRGIMEYSDRLARLSFNYFKEFFDSFGIVLFVINICGQKLWAKRF